MTKTKSAGRKRSAPAFDTEINRAPALRISHIVSGRINENGRVRYFVDPKGTDGERAIPEDVVLKRWRRREMTGHTFHGCRLGPNTWRAIDKAFGNEAQIICQLTVDEISAARKSLQLDDDDQHLWLPEPSSVWSLFNALGPTRLQAVLDRHLSPEREGKFGTPDLFLFAQKGPATTSFYRLVEVKKPREHISRDQHEEIAFLRSIGVPARVLRLIEARFKSS